MIQINNYELPSAWEELSPEDFIATTKIMLLFTEGALTIEETKIRLFCAYTHFRIERLAPALRETFTRNLLVLLEDFNFFYQFVYPEAKFKNISPAIREKLRKTPPDKVKNHEARFADKLKRYCIPDISIRKQIFPELRLSRRHRLPGYIFDGRSGLPETDITAEQFIDASQAYALFDENRDISYLDLLIAILYCKPYDSTKARKLAESVQLVSIPIKNAMLLNFMGIMNWLYNETKYSILFKPGKSSKKKKDQLGMTSVLFSMSEKGYGSLQEVAKLNLFTFFDLIYKNLSDAVAECLAMEMDKSEIAEKLDLPLEVVNQLA